jgi:hypothetical protein
MRDLQRADLAIILLVCLAAAIHVDRAVLNPHIRVLFILNALGYLTLLGLLYLSGRPRRPIRRVLIVYAALTFVLFFVWGMMKGEWPVIGFVDKLVEVLLVGLLLYEDSQDRAAQGRAVPATRT